VTVADSRSSPAKAGLVFFGTVSAAVSHEMRNALAALNENAGLLGDFVLASAKGRPVDPARVETVNGRVARFVSRADALLTSFSRLAHSTDQDHQVVDLRDIADDVVTLCGRLILACGREVQVAAQPGGTVNTSPFFARLLLWRCLEAALADEGQQAPLVIAVARSAGVAQIRISSGGDEDLWQRRGIPGELELELCALALSTIAVDRRSGEMTITWDSRNG